MISSVKIAVWPACGKESLTRLTYALFVISLCVVLLIFENSILVLIVPVAGHC